MYVGGDGGVGGAVYNMYIAYTKGVKSHRDIFRTFFFSFFPLLLLLLLTHTAEYML